MSFLKKNWHFVVVVILSLTPVLWFVGRGDVLINGVDTNFPLDSLVWFKRRAFVWSSVANAGADFSSSTAGLFFHAIQAVPFFFGFSLQQVQIISLVFWFAAVVVSSFLFARQIVPKSRMAQLVFVALYSFNIYLFNTWENVKVSNLSLVVALPAFLAMITAYKAGRLSRARLIFWAAIASVFASGAGINPSYFLTLMGAIFLYYLVVVGGRLFGLALIYIVLVLVNAFWIIPTSHFVLFSSQSVSGLGDLGLVNWLDSLSENTSFTNLLRLQGAWDWYAFDQVTSLPVYLPYTLNYFYNFPFIVYSFVLPFAAIFSLVFYRKSKNGFYLVFGIFLVLALFLGAGTHLSTGGIFRFLANKIPLFSLFRSPWYIFTPLLTLSFAGLSALFLVAAAAFVKKTKAGRRTVLSAGLYVAVVAFLLGHFLYSYPLVTGKVFRPSRDDGFYVSFPGYVFDSKGYLRGREGTFPRLISYPDDQFESFDWGYRGVDSITGLYSDREFIHPTFGGGGRALGEISRNFYQNIKRRQYDSAISTLPLLGADTIFYKRDISSLAPPINTDELEGKVVTIGKWDFIELGGANEKVYAPDSVFVNMGDNGTLGGLAASLPPGLVVINSEDSQLKKIPLDKKTFSYFIEGENVSERKDTGVQEFSLRVSKAGSYKIYLERYGLGEPEDVEVLIDAQAIPGETKVTDSKIIKGPLELAQGEHKVKVLFPEPTNLVDDDARGRLTAFNDEDERISLEVPISGHDPYSDYILSYRYQYLYGSVPLVEVFQGNERTPLRTEISYPQSVPDWVEREKEVDLVETQSYLGMIVTMPKSDFSKSLFENFSLKRKFDNGLFAVEDYSESIREQPKVNFEKVSPVRYKINVEGGGGGYFLVFADSYSGEWELKSKDIVGEPVHFTANGYMNGWYILGGPDRQELEIYYTPQRLFQIGAVISALSLVFGISRWLKK